MPAPRATHRLIGAGERQVLPATAMDASGRWVTRLKKRSRRGDAGFFQYRKLEGGSISLLKYILTTLPYRILRIAR